MPERNAVRFRWNDLDCAEYDGVFGHCVTYWRNRLQDLDERVPPFVTPGSSRPPMAQSMPQAVEYDDPCYSGESAYAECRPWNRQTARNSWHCGSLADGRQPLCEAVTIVTSPEPHRSGA